MFFTYFMLRDKIWSVQLMWWQGKKYLKPILSLQIPFFSLHTFFRLLYCFATIWRNLLMFLGPKFIITSYGRELANSSSVKIRLSLPWYLLGVCFYDLCCWHDVSLESDFLFPHSLYQVTLKHICMYIYFFCFNISS